MRQEFKKCRLSEGSKMLLCHVNAVLSAYAAKGFRLTLRQLYYQLVSQNVIANKESEYAKLSTLLVKGRMGGLVDWAIIEDRIRRPLLSYWVEGVEHALRDTAEQYRLDRQKGQKVYAEVWIEKDALSGLIRQVADEYHIRVMVNRGYSSCSAMYEAAVRFGSRCGQRLLILYIGDHDPSGLDMVRDVHARLLSFGVVVSVRHLALTDEQIANYKPPPNPTKVTDPRAVGYIGRYGHECWEVDALRPDVVQGVLREGIEAWLDRRLFEKMLRLEKRGQRQLGKFAEEVSKRG